MHLRKLQMTLMSLAVLMIAAVWFTPAAHASVIPDGGRNQLSSRLPYRLDLHTGQGADNESGPFRLYWDSGCTNAAPAWRYRGSKAWATIWSETDNGFSSLVTIPIVTVDSSGVDAGLHYTTYWAKDSDLQYVISGTGHFDGADWDESAWWNHLPGGISYAAYHAGELTHTYVGNNIGGFQVTEIDPSDSYFELDAGDYSDRVMWGYLIDYPYYDDSHSDSVNAVYQWNENDHPWTTDGLHQGTNTVYFAGMDWSGNYLTGQRNIRWDTMPPLIHTDLGSVAHNGWLNASLFNSSESFTISSADDESVTTDVSGLNACSLGTVFDGVNRFGNEYGYQAFSYFSDNQWHKQFSYRDVMTELGVQADGTGGQGVHSYHFSDDDLANNWGSYDGTIQIDTVPPTCTASLGQSDWHVGSQPITLTYADATSGVATRQYSWLQSRAQAGAWQDYTGQQLSPPGDGQWYLHWQATDVAGNSGSGVFGTYSRNADLSVKIQTPNSNYLTGEDVITSVVVTNGSATPVLPDDTAVVHFTVYNPDGSVYLSQQKNLVDPAAENNLVWFRWHTSSTGGSYRLTASVTAAGVTPRSGWTHTLSWTIRVPSENAPPQTGLTDTKPSWFSVQTPNPCGFSPSLTWSDWSYTGTFVRRSYTAALTASLSVMPTQTADGTNRIVTATQDAGGLWTMKSGYGISESVSSRVSVSSPTGSIADDASVTNAQLAEGRYPEFNYYYAGYFRLLDSTGNGGFQLKVNPYSQCGFRAHYIPVWYPDGTYTALATTSQAWTPAGMLGTDSAGTVKIQGALPDDWYVRVYPYQ